MFAIEKPKMRYTHQVRSLSTKRRVTIEAMNAIGKPKMNYTHQVRSLSTKRGGGAAAVGDTCSGGGERMYINKE
jgi:hypothetical protein